MLHLEVVIIVEIKLCRRYCPYGDLSGISCCIMRGSSEIRGDAVTVEIMMA